jgi:tetratricopeptide (TPR) repeat protein
VLIWYSTIATPLFGVSDGDVMISDEDTRLILERNLNKYPKSSLFLYLKGKYFRSIQKDLNASLACYEQACEYAKHIKEINLISLYEIGWINLMRLNYASALEQFEKVSKESKWSRCFLVYISAMVSGAAGKCDQANHFIKQALKEIAAQTRKSNPIELFAQKRIEYFKKNQIKSKLLCEFLCVELLYMWVCLPYCEETYLKQMLKSKATYISSSKV